MRHLRLSKLKKEKWKQSKVWDFTVRGWKPVDTEGIEELFVREDTAVTPQKDLSKLKYTDITIGMWEKGLNHLFHFFLKTFIFFFDVT